MFLRIVEIDKDNKDVLELKVSASQNTFIEDIPTCMEEVKQKSYGVPWKPVGIFDGDKLVGFAMFGKSRSGRVWLDRFMIGEQHQLKGYGKRALQMLLRIICSTMKCDTIYLSVHPNNRVAIKLYEENGFYFIDELDGNAPVMKWNK